MGRKRRKEVETWNHGRTNRVQIERVSHNGEMSVVKDLTTGKETRLEEDMGAVMVEEEMNNATVNDQGDQSAQ